MQWPNVPIYGFYPALAANDFAGELPVSPQGEGEVVGNRMYAGYG